jgi:hypothetical protein
MDPNVWLLRIERLNLPLEGSFRVQGSSAEGRPREWATRGVLALCLRIDEDWTVCCESADIRTALRTRC